MLTIMNAGKFDLILDLVLEAQAGEILAKERSENQRHATKIIAYEVIQVLAKLSKKHSQSTRAPLAAGPYELHKWISYWRDYWSSSNELETRYTSGLSGLKSKISISMRTIVYIAIWIYLLLKCNFKKKRADLSCYSIKQGGIIEEARFNLSSPDACAPPIFLMYFSYLKARWFLPYFQYKRFKRIRKNFHYNKSS